METYMMMLYVSLDQEKAVKQFFLDNGWPYCKPDLSVLTDCLGPAFAQPPPVKKSRGFKRKKLTVQKKTGKLTALSPLQTSVAAQTTETETFLSDVDFGESDIIPDISEEPEPKKRKTNSSPRRSLPAGGSPAKESLSTPELGTVNLDGSVKVDEPAPAETSTVMDSSCEENKSNDGSDWEMFNKVKEQSDTPKTGRKKAAQERKKVAKSAKISDMKVETVVSEKVKIVGTPIIVKKEFFACSFCEKTFTIQRHLKNHCKKEHDVEVDCEVKAPEEIENRSYSCNLCKCSYSRVSSLKQHQRIKHGVKFEASEKLFTCNVCFLKYDTSHHLELHQTDKHGTVVNGGAIQHECKKCGQTFQKYRAFRLHKRQHSDNEETKHVCEICGRVFTRADSLLSHRKFIHLGVQRKYPRQCSREKSFVCEICGSGFYRRSNLNEHFTVKHSNEPLNHKCEHCDKTFNRPSLLEYHVNRQHLKEKPYKCDKCNKACFSKHSLHDHKVICNMNSENKISCEQCGKLFTSRHNYKLHIQAVHSNPALVCPCGTVVRWKSSVTKHKRRCSLYNAKLKPKSEPVEFDEGVPEEEDVSDRLVAENAAVVFLQNQYGDAQEVYTEVDQDVEGSTTVVVSEESEVAESVGKLLEAIPGASVEEVGEKHEVTVVEEHVVDGGEAVTYNNVSVVTQDGQDSSQKIYYVIQY